MGRTARILILMSLPPSKRKDGKKGHRADTKPLTGAPPPRAESQRPARARARQTPVRAGIRGLSSARPDVAGPREVDGDACGGSGSCPGPWQTQGRTPVPPAPRSARREPHPPGPSEAGRAGPARGSQGPSSPGSDPAEESGARRSPAEMTPGPFHRAFLPGQPSRGVTRCCSSGPGRAQAGEQGCHLAQALSCPHSSHMRRRGPWSTGRAAGLPPGPPPRQPKGRLGGGFIPLRAAVCHPRCPLNLLLIHSCVSGGVAHASDALPRRRSRPARREALIDACAFPCGCQGAGHQLPEGL